MAVSQSLVNKFTPNAKDINYLSKNFSEFRGNLIEFAKAYYPNTYSDFNEASPGMMFIEMASYMGDVLSFYIDKQFKENLLLHASERENVIMISQAFGYKPRLSAAATVTATIHQMVPARDVTNGYEPDARFFLRINSNSKFSTNGEDRKVFTSMDDVDFADPTDRAIRVFSRNQITDAPTMYVVTKPIKLISAEIRTETFSFGSPEKFSKITLNDPNVIAIVQVTDSDNQTWSEVDYLGQDLIIEERDVSARESDGYLTSDDLPRTSIPPTKMITFKRKPRRFVTRINEQMEMEMWFGSGDGTSAEEVLQINANQIANTKYNQTVGNVSLDPADFLSSDTFGIAPANTLLTVRYLAGGGMESNVVSGRITEVDFVDIENNPADYPPGEQGLFYQIVDSIAIYNDEPATGGGTRETTEEIRQNALAFFNAQNRVVTDKDYVVRTLSMPPKFGAVAKAFVVRDEQINAIGLQDELNLEVNNDENPFNNRRYVIDPVVPNAINLYTLGYNSQKRLTSLNSLVKENIARYLEQYRVLTDDVNILDAFVINIGVDFNIVVYRNYNMNDVLARSIDVVAEFFNIDRWQINQPIIMNDLRLAIGMVDGVQTVTDVSIVNKYNFKHGRDYQDYRYPIEEAIVDDVVYPSLDPSIWEIRYPDTDIVGHAKQ